jgi:uncharacterized protein VirK/YbjX
MLKQLSLILRSSSKITVEPDYRKKKLSPLKYGPVVGRSHFFIMAFLNAKAIILMKQETVYRFRRLIEEHPESIPSLFWPYQCVNWDTSERIDYLYNHFETLPDLRYPINSLADQQSTLANINAIYPKLSIVIDKNDLYMREGMLTINLFIDHERIFTIAFSFYTDNSGEICAITGAIQGRRMVGITDLYRDMTKKTYGIRPRDLIIEAFLILCRLSGVKKVFAVSESHRQHNHIFYGIKSKGGAPSLNYDEVWSDRGGYRCDEALFHLPLRPKRKSLSAIASKKRSMYRSRYTLLNLLENKIKHGLSATDPRTQCNPHHYEADIQLVG